MQENLEKKRLCVPGVCVYVCVCVCVCGCIVFTSHKPMAYLLDLVHFYLVIKWRDILVDMIPQNQIYFTDPFYYLLVCVKTAG